MIEQQESTAGPASERERALAWLAAERHVVAENQPFTVRRYQPEDGPGVARLFYAVYGDGYPVDTYYIPERLTQANQDGSLLSSVACTEAGDVVSHSAFYRSSPPNPRLYEFGLGLTLPSYRSSTAFGRCIRLQMSLLGTEGIDAFYGEPVTNHIITQKLTWQTGAPETAMEPALMPAQAYVAEQSAAGRVGCLMNFKVINDQRRPLCVPACYRDEIALLGDGLGLDREVLAAAAPTQGRTRIDVVRFGGAGVARCSILEAGADLAERLAAMAAEQGREGDAVMQCFLPLGRPWAEAAVETLRELGFFLGGYLPLWFGDDGLLMQRLSVAPGFEQMLLFTDRAHRIRELIQADWRRAQALAR